MSGAVIRGACAALALSLACVLTTVHAQSADGATNTPSTRDARVIVQFRAGASVLREKAASTEGTHALRAAALGARHGLALRAGSGISERSQVMFATGITSDELARVVASDADVEYAVPDRRRRRASAPNDPLYADGLPGNGPAAGQWYLRPPTATTVSSIDAEPAWDITRGDPSVVVAVLDTGVRFEHPDLLSVVVGGNLLSGFDMIADVPTANDGDGRDADASDPGDWVTAAEANDPNGDFYQCTDQDPTTGRYVGEPSSWHGTQVSGIIAALTDNNLGMASVARTVRVLPVRVIGKCGGFDSDIVAGMRWAAGLSVPGVPPNINPARIINMSIQGDQACPSSYQDTVDQLVAMGVTIVAAAGNLGHGVATPASCPGVLAVGGLRHAGTKVGYSSLGPEVAIGAPAGNCPLPGIDDPCSYPILSTSNTGLTTPLASTYTDAFNPTLGTSFSSPLVAGTVALMRSARPSLTPLQIRLLLETTARPFPTTGGDNGDGTPVPACTQPQFDTAGDPIDQLQCYCNIDTCGAGMVDAGAAVKAASIGTLASGGLGVEGLWWALPGGSESGWGLNIAQQANLVFATWFTYDRTGKAWWLSMTGTRTATSPDTYTGDLVQTQGPPFSAVPFDPARVTRTVVGNATLTFTDANRATFAYQVNGEPQTKTLTRQAFGPLPTCTYAGAPNLAAATNYQDLWWVPGGAESGWGINLTQQGDVIFATWFTYGADGNPLWLSVTATKSADGVYGGTLYQTAGPAFDAVPFDPGAVTRQPVGTATFTFQDGNTASFAYVVNGVAQSKTITRELFAPPGATVCQ